MNKATIVSLQIVVLELIRWPILASPMEITTLIKCSVFNIIVMGETKNMNSEKTGTLLIKRNRESLESRLCSW